MFRRVPLSIIRSSFTVHSAMVYFIQVCRQLSSRSICSCSKAVYKPVWHIPLLSVQWINSWWWTEELSETCRFWWQIKFVKLVHLVGFITKKFVTMHGHMNVKNGLTRSICFCSKAVYRHVWHIPLLSVQWINSWWWLEELSETCSVWWQIKFVKLVHLVGFITKKFVTMHGHMNVKKTV